MSTLNYRQIAAPDGVVFDVPRANQGQIVEVAYAGRLVWDNQTYREQYKRVTDMSLPVTDPERVTYWQIGR